MILKKQPLVFVCTRQPTPSPCAVSLREQEPGVSGPVMLRQISFPGATWAVDISKGKTHLCFPKLPSLQPLLTVYPDIRTSTHHQLWWTSQCQKPQSRGYIWHSSRTCCKFDPQSPKSSPGLGHCPRQRCPAPADGTHPGTQGCLLPASVNPRSQV